MSVAHLRLIQVKNDNSFVGYKVESFDFNAQRKWEEVGQILIDKKNKNYEFQPSQVWKDSKVIPPWIYGKSEAEREVLLKTEYKDFGWGAWSIRIHHWATSFIEKGSFPEYFPPIFFPELKAQENADRVSS